MKYALVKGQKSEPKPKMRGICQYCNSPVIARCGPINKWHWAHIPNSNCDPWWDNETEWHRKWKNYFKKENQEIVHFADNGEKHIADIKTDDGLVIELQNSSISNEEIKSRNSFYHNIIWIVNGENFRERLYLLHSLPDPDIPEMDDIRVMFSYNKNYHPAIYYASKKKTNSSMVEVYGLYEIKHLIEQSYRGHHLFAWDYPRKNWLRKDVPVFFDIGDNFLYQLKVYGESKILCIQIVSKQFIVEQNGGCYTYEGDPDELKATFLQGKGIVI